MTINKDEILVKIKFIESQKLKAIIGLNFGDFVIKGFRVSESEYENDRGQKLWLTPPSYKDSGGRYHPMFFMPNKELWKELEAKIWDEYKLQSEEHHKKRFDLE
ncbi:MAG: hypothetical protein C3F02_04370 [Parcubacteria group bacterium]|nr:MAG: hypothetical protein C3F02_04370 [Parcubacteria group bacterium]